MAMTAAQRSARARMGAYARQARMTDEERVAHARRMSEAHRDSFDNDFAYKAHMTGLAFRSSRRRTRTPVSPSSPGDGTGVAHRDNEETSQ